MISETDRIIRQLNDFYSEDNWVTANFKTKVLSLSSDHALQRVSGHTHSVADQVAHMLAWRNFVLQKLTGNDDFDITDNSSDDWPEVKDWSTLVKKFDETHSKLIHAIKTFPSEKLGDTVPLRDDTFTYLLNGILEHDYYHAGQIGAVLAETKRLGD